MVVAGTTRHVSTLSDLPWQNELVEEKAFQDLYAQDFEFSVPDGLDFVSADPSVHSSSVLVYHPASRSLHVDDTLLYIKLLDKVQFHTKLAQSLSDRQGSSRDFKDWAEETFTRKWPGIMNLLCAHTHYLTNEQKGEERKGKNEEKDEGTAALSVINQRIMQALAGCQSTFDKHEKKYIEKSCDKSDCSVM